MSRVYCPRHPERTVFYRVLFHYFESFLLEYENRFERHYGHLRSIIQEVVDKYLGCGNPKCGFARIRCPKCGGTMRIVSFIEDYKVIDKIIKHLNLTFKATRPPPPQAQLSMAAEELSEYM